MEDLLRELMEIVKNTAPELWRIGLQQVSAIVWQKAAIIIGSLLFLGISLFMTIKSLGMEHSESNSDFPVGLFMMGSFILISALIVGVVTAVEIIPLIINPEYYAIKEIMSLIK